MAVVEYPEMYKSAHIEHLLNLVPQWQAKDVNGGQGSRSASTADKGKS